MPIRSDLRHFYQGPQWQETRKRILARANNCCEECGVPNHTIVARAMRWWAIVPESWWFEKWEADRYPEIVWRNAGEAIHEGDNFPREICRRVYIVLTIAHLNNISGDDRDENLKALCQYCHLTMDARFHKQTRCANKDRRRPLLQEMTA